MDIDIQNLILFESSFFGVVLVALFAVKSLLYVFKIFDKE